MAIPLIDPLRHSLSATAGDVAERAGTGAATVALGCVAVALLAASAIVALTAVIGFALAALAVGAVFAMLSLGVHLLGRRLSVRRGAERAALRRRAATDIAVVAGLSRPLMPLAAFAIAFALIQRR